MQDQVNEALRLSGAFQPSIDCVGQADYFRRRTVRFICRPVMLRYLSGDLLQQSGVRNRDKAAAADTFEV